MLEAVPPNARDVSKEPREREAAATVVELLREGTGVVFVLQQSRETNGTKAVATAARPKLFELLKTINETNAFLTAAPYKKRCFAAGTE